MKKWYVGKKLIRPSLFLKDSEGMGSAIATSDEVFVCEQVPTETSHGNQYAFVIGPFRTRRGAEYMAAYGGDGNPHCITVADAEKLAKKG